MDSDTRTAGLALAINAAPNWTICACADLFFPLRRETNIRRSARLITKRRRRVRQSSSPSSLDGICQGVHEYALGQRPLFGMCGNWIGPGSIIECLLSAGAGPAVSAGTRGSPWPAAYVRGARGCPVPAWSRWSAASGVARLALGEADSWMILCLQIRSGRQPAPTTVLACPRLEGSLGLATAPGGVQPAARPARARMSSEDGLYGSLP